MSAQGFGCEPELYLRISLREEQQMTKWRFTDGR
jgi:hypothetical protein